MEIGGVQNGSIGVWHAGYTPRPRHVEASCESGDRSPWQIGPAHAAGTDRPDTARIGDVPPPDATPEGPHRTVGYSPRTGNPHGAWFAPVNGSLIDVIA